MCNKTKYRCYARGCPQMAYFEWKTPFCAPYWIERMNPKNVDKTDAALHLKCLHETSELVEQTVTPWSYCPFHKYLYYETEGHNKENIPPAGWTRPPRTNGAHGVYYDPSLAPVVHQDDVEPAPSFESAFLGMHENSSLESANADVAMNDTSTPTSEETEEDEDYDSMDEYDDVHNSDEDEEFEQEVTDWPENWPVGADIVVVDRETGEVVSFERS
ncbi:hypothetical protein BU23DRAFT_628722 [Bimuria novae-zelandiae CBS 107.79]|uniref:Uncharacterized protein n=1 Tax=Bimuria novae-zelandiae CBS 107.79 TaxID=1447943 RepID=A0A6A5UK54_9PLEO|nr:hypothetical protein BU23DRAFT_628722 [Bimuria novae-zelandiae CBS 107.79]